MTSGSLRPSTRSAHLGGALTNLNPLLLIPLPCLRRRGISSFCPSEENPLGYTTTQQAHFMAWWTDFDEEYRITSLVLLDALMNLFIPLLREEES